MAITLLQDHTSFMDRMILSSYDHPHGLPLSVSALNLIRSKRVGAKYKGKVRTLGQLTELAEQADPGEQRRIAKVMASAVELDIEGWYCIADDEGANWLKDHHTGPLLEWNGALWWGRLKGQDIEERIQRHEHFKPRSNRPKQSAQQETEPERPWSPGSPRLFRPRVGEIE